MRWRRAGSCPPKRAMRCMPRHARSTAVWRNTPSSRLARGADVRRCGSVPRRDNSAPSSSLSIITEAVRKTNRVGSGTTHRSSILRRVASTPCRSFAQQLPRRDSKKLSLPWWVSHPSSPRGGRYRSAFCSSMVVTGSNLLGPTLRAGPLTSCGVDCSPSTTFSQTPPTVVVPRTRIFICPLSPAVVSKTCRRPAVCAFCVASGDGRNISGRGSRGGRAANPVMLR